MSLIEHYPEELGHLDSQIRRYASICGIAAGDTAGLEAVIHDHAAGGHKGTLRALLILRTTVQAKMMDDGMTP